ncbi:hypothetical protein D3Z36_14060 [Lachnospiraceae bacterium]|nr:hypothetical protein [Lachnospiraceae bacterium]
MKIFLSILLSLVISVMGFPMADQAKTGEDGLSELTAEKNITDIIERATGDTKQKEKTESGTKIESENINLLKEDKISCGETRENTEKKAENTGKKKGGQENKKADKKRRKELAPKDPKAGETHEKEQKDPKQGLSTTERSGEIKTGDKEQIQEQQGEEKEQALEAETQEKAASLKLEDLIQNTEKKTLKLRDYEMLENNGKTGYTTEISRKINCRHTTGDIDGSIRCNVAEKPLNPSQEELKKNIVLTGKLKGKSVIKNVERYDAGGNVNTVTHQRLKVYFKDVPEIEPEFLASPYICPDGNAGYAYFEFHYSYCPNTEKFYKVQESHVWLGCTRGDGGFQEIRPLKLNHTFEIYKLTPNKYKVAYDANGGSGDVSEQNATYDTVLTLREGRNYKRTGHTLTGWNTRKNGTGKAYQLGEAVTNLTSVNGGQVTLYAQWAPNVLTIKYDANRGISSGSSNFQIETFFRNWKYGGNEQDPVDVASFGLSRPGYSIKEGAEWNTSPSGTGVSFDQSKDYAMTAYAPALIYGNQTVILYANWEPDIYTITLDHQLTGPETAGTEKIYKKYETGMYVDKSCTEEMDGNQIGRPQKDGYIFQGYYSEKAEGTEMINASGQLTKEGRERRNSLGDETWYARYAYMVKCEDYADIPCDLEKADKDNREDLGVRLTYNRSTRKVMVYTGRTKCSVSLEGMKAGTYIGKVPSVLSAGSISGHTGGTQTAELPFTVLEGTAYRLKVEENGMIFCDRLVYYKEGRFRTLAKLGNLKEKKAAHGSSLAGSDWNKEEEGYNLYQYYGCSELRDIQEPGTVQRYFQYKSVNMAYSGNGATTGKNILENNVSLEDNYRFRDNGFTRKVTEKKYTEKNKEYECEVIYSFQGWEMNQENIYSEKQEEHAYAIYDAAKLGGGISGNTIEDISTYESEEPVRRNSASQVINLHETVRGNQEAEKKALIEGGVHTVEYINFQAKWDACPTIVVNPEEKLEFFEGEEVTKEKIISHLTAHDNEDNKDTAKRRNLNDKLRIVKISYPESQNKSQAAYEKQYKDDVPKNFLLDTYYLKLEQDETVEVFVTFAVTDSKGNTTEEEFPLTVKYNHYPEINSNDVFYYMKEEANHGEITAEALISRASAKDEEDGSITSKLELTDFDPQEFKLQSASQAEFDITYQVTDAYKKTTFKTVKVLVWDEQAARAEKPKYYVRFISEKHLDTLENNSIWRRPENFAYLRQILKNETPIETWIFSKEDVHAVQKWITAGGEGNWKIGQEANRAFLVKFIHCRQ